MQINFSISMKKRTYLLLSAVILFFCSCEDKSGDYVEQLFTNTQISNALKQCIDSTMVRTLNVLCVVDTIHQELGFSYYDGKTYRILLPPDAKNVMDTLEEYGYKEHLEALILDMNRAAEQCGDRIVQFWNPIVRDMIFPNPNLLLHSGNSAITDHVRQTKQNEFINILVSYTLKEQFDALDVIARWNELQKTYFEITGKYSSIDILTPAAQQMSGGFFKKMALEEEALRKDPALRGPITGLLYRVFETL